MPGDGIDDVHNLVLPGIGGGKFSGRLVKGGGGDGIDTALSGSIKHPNGSFFTGTFLSGTEYMDTYGRHTEQPKVVRGYLAETKSSPHTGPARTSWSRAKRDRASCE